VPVGWQKTTDLISPFGRGEKKSAATAEAVKDIISPDVQKVNKNLEGLYYEYENVKRKY